jgi:flagellar hook-basal body complex protein FliE
MAGPIQFDPSLGLLGTTATGAAQGSGATRQSKTAAETASPGPSFQSVLMESLNQVNRLQEEASQGVDKLVTGQTTNVAEVFSAARKADIAFSLLMEMRNKLLEAYQEVRQMQV